MLLQRYNAASAIVRRSNRKQVRVISAALAVLSLMMIGNAWAEIPLPPACSVLTAHLTDAAVDSPRVDLAMDTARIQQALNLCSPGRAVVLQVRGKSDAFLSAPLILPRGVTLWIDRGVTLYASRNPRDYDLSPFVCGRTASGRVPVCKPFIYAYQAVYSGILGGGTIDGQGGRPLEGSQDSWWQLANRRTESDKKIAVPDLVSSYESQGFRMAGVTLRNAAGVHAAIYKTIGFTASQLQIDSSAASHHSTGILLSNSPGAVITDSWIRIPADAIALKASILGPTSRVSIRNVHIFGGRGISIGDDVYGNVSDVEVDRVSLDHMRAGISFDLKGSHGGTAHNITFNNVCMRSVKGPLQAVKEDGSLTTELPPLPDIRFNNVIVNGKGRISQNTFESVSDSACDDLPAFSSAPRFAAVPDLRSIQIPGTRRSLVVAKDGSGDFTSIQQAVDALPVSGGDIRIKHGTYREVVTIRKPHVHLHGDDADPSSTVIVYGNGAPNSGGTFNTATVFVEADDVTMDGITIENDFGFGKGQAVALSVTADRAVFRHMRLLGAQDTLFAASKYCYGDYGPCAPTRQYFADSYIEGNVDFIFGDSKAFFDHSELHGLPYGNVMFTAQDKHSTRQPSGYVFDHCRLTADPRPATISLGRPWRPHATVVYLNTRIDAPVIPAGWTEWKRFGIPSLPVAYYAEFNSSGPGANPKAREPHSHQLTKTEAQQWSTRNFLAGDDGWNPAKKHGLPPKPGRKGHLRT